MSSQYSKGLTPWDHSNWSNNLINRGVANQFEFLGANPSQFYGQDTDYLRGQLKNTLAGGLDPALVQAQAQERNDISRLGDTARLKTDQSLSSRGFRGSGANLINDIFSTQTNAINQSSANFGLMGLENRNKALFGLLGLNTEGTNVNTGVAGQQIDIAQFLASLGEGRNRSDFQAGQQPGAWGQIAGGLAQGAATAGTTALIAASDIKVKENISYTNKTTKDGIPIVDFNYKGNNQRFRGVIAQEVEKVRPDAVVEINGIKHVNYGVL